MVFLFAGPRRLFYFPFALNPTLHTRFGEICFMCDGSSTIWIFPLFFNPILHMGFRESCFMCDGSSTVWIFPLFLTLFYTWGLGIVALCVIVPQPY
jgi:hypothetical protein